MEEEKVTTEEQPEKKKRKTWMWILIILLAATVVWLAMVLFLQKDAPEEVRTYETEIAAKLGQLENKSEAEIQEELNRVVEEGMFHVAINGRPIFENGEAEGNLEIENVPNNRYLMRVEIELDDTGELVYSTKYIEPNMHIQRAKLDVPLSEGTYAATAVFYAYDPETLMEMGSISNKITVYVLG